MEDGHSGWSARSLFIATLAVLAVVGLGIGVATLLPSSIEFKPQFDAIDYLEHLAMLVVIATAIERATQSVLLLTQTDGTDRNVVAATGIKPKDGARTAMVVSLSLGLAVGLTGIGVIGPLVQIEPVSTAAMVNMAQEVAEALKNAGGEVAAKAILEVVAQTDATVPEGDFGLSQSILRGVDTIVTGGLLAGGASGIHQVSEAVKRLVRGPNLARADVLAGGPLASATAPVLTLEREPDGARLWHEDRVFTVEGTDDGVQEGIYHRVALRGGATEYMFLEFPLMTAEGRVPTITTTDLARGGLSMTPEDLKVLTARLGNTTRNDIKVVVRTVG